MINKYIYMLLTSCQWYHKLPKSQQIIYDDDGWRDGTINFHKTLISESEFKKRYWECSMLGGESRRILSLECQHCMDMLLKEKAEILSAGEPDFDSIIKLFDVYFYAIFLPTLCVRLLRKK